MSTFVSKRNLARQTFCCYRDVLWQRRSVKGTMLLLPGTRYLVPVPGTWYLVYLVPGTSTRYFTALPKRTKTEILVCHA